MARVRVYTFDNCPYCKLVKELLSSRGVEFEDVDMTDNDELREQIAQKSGRLTAPQVFVGEKCLGGYEEIKVLDKEGDLAKAIYGS